MAITITTPSTEHTLSERVRELAQDVWRYSRRHDRKDPHRSSLLRRINELRAGVPNTDQNPLRTWLENLERKVAEV